jgi:hypothetical protein
MHKPEDELPKAPDMPRRLVFNRTKLVGLPLLLSVPVLAVFGIFGISEGEVSAAAEGIEAHLNFPERSRYKVSDQLELTLRNTAAEGLPRVTVRFDLAYVSAFSEVHFTPEPKRITEHAYEVELDNIGPGETRRIHVSLQGNEYGRHRGTVSIAVNGTTTNQLSVDTLTFP